MTLRIFKIVFVCSADLFPFSFLSAEWDKNGFLPFGGFFCTFIIFSPSTLILWASADRGYVRCHQEWCASRSAKFDSLTLILEIDIWCIWKFPSKICSDRDAMGLQSFFFFTINIVLFSLNLNIPINTNKYSSETEVITKSIIDPVVADVFVVWNTTVIFTITQKN